MNKRVLFVSKKIKLLLCVSIALSSGVLADTTISFNECSVNLKGDVRIELIRSGEMMASYFEEISGRIVPRSISIEFGENFLNDEGDRNNRCDFFAKNMCVEEKGPHGNYIYVINSVDDWAKYHMFGFTSKEVVDFFENRCF